MRCSCSPLLPRFHHKKWNSNGWQSDQIQRRTQHRAERQRPQRRCQVRSLWLWLLCVFFLPIDFCKGEHPQALVPFWHQLLPLFKLFILSIGLPAPHPETPGQILQGRTGVGVALICQTPKNVRDHIRLHGDCMKLQLLHEFVRANLQQLLPQILTCGQAEI